MGYALNLSGWRYHCRNQLKETGITHWQSPNTGAANGSGFTAIPGGYRGNDGTFNGIRKDGYLWSSSENSSIDAIYRVLYYDSGNAVSVIVIKGWV